ncbi:MAG: hypothetical protein JXA09_09425 [Anaerolineae bacterium]|nr:hypothetical protein [Anaerolineae bacterium]
MLSRGWTRSAVLAVALLAVIWGSGCRSIQVIDRTPSTTEPTPSTPDQDADRHNLAVLAVDFDPPLEYAEIVALRDRGEGITLLVAIENSGTTTEHEVVVDVALSKGEEQVPFLDKRGEIDVIAPGEIKLVRFKDAEIPFSQTYQLVVRALPVDGETRLGDNVKSYDLVIAEP